MPVCQRLKWRTRSSSGQLECKQPWWIGWAGAWLGFLRFPVMGKKFFD